MKSAENLASPVVLCTCTETTAKFFFVVGKGNFGGKKYYLFLTEVLLSA
jgi:hypothetical protein